MKEEIKKEEDNRCKEDSKRVGDLE